LIGRILRSKLLYLPTGKYNKTEILKKAVCRFVEVTDKEISEIKINAVPKNTKGLRKNTKTIIRLRLGDYRGIFTSTSSRRIFPDNHLTFGE
jgi:mRNA-degrading endonuclease RelE of RelBE toxin-antitoxin system